MANKHRYGTGPQDHNRTVTRLFFRMLPVQVGIVAMGAINSIINGVVAARAIGPDAVGVVGLYYTMSQVLSAGSGVLLGGVAILSGRYLGSGKIKEARGICSLGMFLALIFGAVLSLASIAVPGPIAGLLGASESLRAPLAAYTLGCGIGIIPQVLGQVMAANLQMERQEKLGQVGVVVMIVLNAALDILFVYVLKMEHFGLALATSLSNWAYFLVLGQFYLRGKAQLKPSLRMIDWHETPMLLKTGLPGALLVSLLAVRSLILNRILLTYAGNDGLSALSTFNMISGLIIAVALGTGSLIRMLCSVFIGEKNPGAVKAAMKCALTKVMLIIVGIGVLEVIFAPLLTKIFYPDPAAHVYEITRQLIFIYGFCLPIMFACVVFYNYAQALGHRAFVNIMSAVDALISLLIPALILAPIMGALGVWLSFAIALVITLAVYLIYPRIRLKRWPKTMDEWLLLPPDMEEKDKLVVNMEKMEEITSMAARVQDFCEQHGMDKKTSSFAGLCLEEMAGNIIEHGFSAGKREHDLEVRIMVHEKETVLRIKDDCVPFDPKEWMEMTSGREDPLANVGIRLVYGIAKQVDYQNLLGMNVLTITL